MVVAVYCAIYGRTLLIGHRDAPQGQLCTCAVCASRASPVSTSGCKHTVTVTARCKPCKPRTLTSDSAPRSSKCTDHIKRMAWVAKADAEQHYSAFNAETVGPSTLFLSAFPIVISVAVQVGLHREENGASFYGACACQWRAG